MFKWGEVVTTAEQLSELPSCAVVVDRRNTAWQKLNGTWGNRRGLTLTSEELMLHQYEVRGGIPFPASTPMILIWIPNL